MNEIEGTLTIRNNDGNVVLDSTRLSGSGTLVLDNATLGSAAEPIRVDLGQIQMTDGSTLYTGYHAAGTEMSFDNSDNTVVFTS
ncbi:hypothetical protein AA103196_2728 [Ameyamaea chiangmaiensis NBRC 103196]|uniref:Uncharacterized protein n=1 Tax=Ameyamaea chiangmaiensis TaxID=442969 RepID=A0A850PB62_9PROT|nr:hypothetical protein [Ameyamaea chiangmaiensis]MBS4074219.1 hypothetical protein [Ameyamaea chiangmaiensis]NVN39162.1 hypothetical protein [Ameyamaea chiangmaiensis]GBQ71283.1 hypothetical protein AA103196_2728 [Ameyamaea chiangmaiensis NBRC 103196]